MFYQKVAFLGIFRKTPNFDDLKPDLQYKIPQKELCLIYPWGRDRNTYFDVIYQKDVYFLDLLDSDHYF
jgi:hypothetical protein